MTAYVLRLWALKYDTWRIAQMCKLEEAAICRIIAADQDRRFAEKQGRAA